MAAAVFCRRGAGAAYFICPRKSKRARSLASLAHRLADLPTSNLWELAALRVSRGAHGHGEFHFARHAGHVSNFFAAPARFQPAAHFGLYRVFYGWRDLRRVGVRIFLRPQRTSPRDGEGAAFGLLAHSLMGVRAKPSAHSGGRIPDAIHGARRSEERRVGKECRSGGGRDG